jgi:hypothetical protein
MSYLFSISILIPYSYFGTGWFLFTISDALNVNFSTVSKCLRRLLLLRNQLGHKWHSYLQTISTDSLCIEERAFLPKTPLTSLQPSPNSANLIQPSPNSAEPSHFNPLQTPLTLSFNPLQTPLTLSFNPLQTPLALSCPLIVLAASMYSFCFSSLWSRLIIPATWGPLLSYHLN